MITIEPDDIEGTFVKLLSPRQKAEALESLLNGLTESSVKTKIGKRSLISDFFNSGEIPMPPPLSELELSLYSDGMVYSGILWIRYPLSLTNSQRQEGQKKSINALSRENKIVFENGAAFLIGQEPMFILDYNANKTNGNPTLSFGRSGTCKRKLTSLEQFETDFRNLCSVSAEAVNSFYEGKSPDYKVKFYV